ncbi:galactose oxidase early set domain-containing protein [Cryptosporangium minutisporangium]|uniref:Galactose oxidase-like Early set domain-containing protein n=1 Tax=Cryptosporangium minutisporangium TaxID=113569 RepID=A0ABP6SVU2_9ACTN
MPSSPAIIGPVSTCSTVVRVQGTHIDATVRIYLEGDANPLGEARAWWTETEVNIDKSRLVPDARLVATQQEVGGVESPHNQRGERVEKAVNRPVTVPHPIYVCARSVAVTRCSPGATVEVWQGGAEPLGSAVAVGDLAEIEFAGTRRIFPGVPVEVHQTICTDPISLVTFAGIPQAAPGTSRRTLPSPTFATVPRPLEECQGSVNVEGIVAGAVVRIVRERGGQRWIVFEGPCPFPQREFVVGDPLQEGERFEVTQSMQLGCELGPDSPNVATVQPLTSLDRPLIEGPLCAGPHKVVVKRLKAPAILRLFSAGAEIGNWPVSSTEMPVDIDVPAGPITARQELCGIISPESRPYKVASGRRGRWFLVEDSKGDVLRADAFAIHAALVRTGHIVIFSGDQHSLEQNKRKDIDHCQLFDCADLSIQKIDAPTTDVFCSGHAFLPDGHLLVAGGTQAYPEHAGEPHGPHGHFPGLAEVWQFNPDPGSAGRYWVQTESTRGGRWYPTLLTLADGAVLALSGHPASTDTRHNNNSLEIYDPATDRWTHHGDSPDLHHSNAGVANSYLYPRIFVGPDERVFSASPLLPASTGDLRQSGSWMPRVGTTWTRTAMPVGGDWAGYDGFGFPAVLLPLLETEPGPGDPRYRFRVVHAGGNRAWIADLGTPADPESNPQWQVLGGDTAPLRPVRVNSNAVLLPSGEVLICGGVRVPDREEDTWVSEPEMIVNGPGGWQWSADSYAPAEIPRNYHSTALLMPDGRIFTGGTNINCKPGGVAVRRLEIEIYEPWYMCADRPSIWEAPTEVRPDETINVMVVSSDPITRLAFLRVGSSTHAFNPDQRYIGLRARHAGSERYSAVIPDRAVAVPGYYLLYACTEASVPSEGVFIRILPG